MDVKGAIIYFSVNYVRFASTFKIFRTDYRNLSNWVVYRRVLRKKEAGGIFLTDYRNLSKWVVYRLVLRKNEADRRHPLGKNCPEAKSLLSNLVQQITMACVQHNYRKSLRSKKNVGYFPIYDGNCSHHKLWEAFPQ